LGSRPCQKRRGDVVENGEDPAGDASSPMILSCDCHVRLVL
jgi:hypothetical protein